MESEELITDKIEFSYIFHHKYLEVVRLLRNTKKTNTICSKVKEGYITDFFLTVLKNVGI